MNFSNVDQIWSTLAVNLIGCFALGFVLVHGEKYLKHLPSLQQVWRPFLATGLLGGFTTTSAFAVQTVELVQKSYTVDFLLVFFASLIGGIVAFHIAHSIALKGARS